MRHAKDAWRAVGDAAGTSALGSAGAGDPGGPSGSARDGDSRRARAIGNGDGSVRGNENGNETAEIDDDPSQLSSFAEKLRTETYACASVFLRF